MTTIETTTIQDAIDAFVAILQERSDTYFATSFPTLTPSKFETSKGQRFVKVIEADGVGSSRSVVAFIDRSTGDIFKPAGWKAPAKHVRGNVLSTEQGAEAIEGGHPHIRYLR